MTHTYWKSPTSHGVKLVLFIISQFKNKCVTMKIYISHITCVLRFFFIAHQKDTFIMQFKNWTLVTPLYEHWLSQYMNIRTYFLKNVVLQKKKHSLLHIYQLPLCKEYQPIYQYQLFLLGRALIAYFCKAISETATFQDTITNTNLVSIYRHFFITSSL